MFSAQRRQISAFCLLALTTEAWRGAESGMLRKTYTLIYPDPTERNLYGKGRLSTIDLLYSLVQVSCFFFKWKFYLSFCFTSYLSEDI